LERNGKTPRSFPRGVATVIASKAKQSGGHKEALDCFVRFAPRNDDGAY
jgi:hypothetical protein